MNESENMTAETVKGNGADLFGYEEPVKKTEESEAVPASPRAVSYPEDETVVPASPRAVSYPEDEKAAPAQPLPAAEPVRYSAMEKLNLPKDASIGSFLREGRRACGLTVEQVANATFINPLYIESLEEDRNEKMPALVFVKGYVRRMGELYGFDEACLEMLNEKLNERERKTDVPEKLIQNIEQTGQVNEAEMKRMKMMLIYTILIAASLLSLICTTVIAISLSRRSAAKAKPDVNVEKFDSSKLEKLVPVQVPEIKLMNSPSQTGKK